MEKYIQRIANAKRRRRIFVDKESPFPVPISSISNEPSHSAKWSFYTGHLIDNYVVVSHTGDMEFLYRKGFFGKGSLSRNQPVYEQGGANHFYGKKNKNEQMLRITSRRKYLRHLSWKTGEQVAILPLRSQSKHELQNKKYTKVEETAPISTAEIPTQCIGSNNTEESTSQKPQVMPPDSWVVLEQDSLVASGAAEDPWATCTEAETDSFWGEPGQSGDLSRGCDNSIWGESSQSSAIPSYKTDPSCSGNSGTVNTDSEAVTDGNNLSPEECSTHTTQKKDSYVAQNSDKADRGCSDHILSKDDNKEDDCHSSDKVCVQFYDTNSEKSESCATPNLSTKHLQYEHDSKASNNASENLDTCTTQDVATNKDSAAQTAETQTSGENCSTNMKKQEGKSTGNKMSKTVPTDPLCLSDHEDGDLFVINDTDESDQEYDSSEYDYCDEDCDNMIRAKRYKWEPAVKSDPFKPKEVLKLSLEEAFFLSFGLGCLVVIDEEQKLLNLSEMWTTFCERQKNFIPNYVVYHYYRSKGWVPKAGLKFGGDFLIYKDGPPFYHASYVVMVRYVDENLCDDISDQGRGKLSWQMIAGQNRVTEQVNKELMLCYVIKPANITDDQLKSPNCISQLKLQEVLVKRWMTKSERDNLKFTEIP